MINDNELRISSESYTKKDFYQIYPEILDLVNKITERWDPASSNESDPGVVLLKLLAFIADKNNYNIDKNILECFMPSATQEDSMRKLCDMMGYSMKYYRSATTKVSFMWVGPYNEEYAGLPDTSGLNGKPTINIPRFTELTDNNGEINFVLTEPITLSYRGQTITKEAIEGTLQDLDINSDGIIRLNNLDDHNRLYLPESQIAENGIWIWNVTDSDSQIEYWKKVDNLNIQKTLVPVYKFGFDSRRRLPYIVFPQDIGELIKDGLKLKYIRTSGSTGNVTANVITKLTKLSEVPYIPNLTDYDGKYADTESLPVENDGENYLVIKNTSYTLNGSDIETLDQAYNNFKKTIGTFNTLVTCRDYANAIYNLVYSDFDQNNLVSNVQVSDIKDDINFANKIVSFDDFGMFYSDLSAKSKPIKVVTSLPDYSSASEEYFYYLRGTFYQFYKNQVDITQSKYIEVSEQETNLINNFNLFIYPLKNVNSFYKSTTYEDSFKPQYYNTLEIINKLEDYKTVSHIIKQVSNEDDDFNIYNIKNYYHLNAKISTTYKVTHYEADEILQNIYYALWQTFNARKLDYGEELSYDILLSTIQTADSRIKVVSLDEPQIKTNVMSGNGKEYTLMNYDGSISQSDSSSIFYKLIAKNILAGRIPLFKYDTRFEYSIGELNSAESKVFGKVYSYYPSTQPLPTHNIIPEADQEKYSITAISTEVSIPSTRIEQGYTLKKHENVQLIAPNLNTLYSYPCYVNYYFDSPFLTSGSNTPCHLTKISNTGNINADCFLIGISGLTEDISSQITSTAVLRQTVDFLASENKCVWIPHDGDWQKCTSSSTYDSTTHYYKTKTLNQANSSYLWSYCNDSEVVVPKSEGLYIVSSADALYIPGYLINDQRQKFVYYTNFSAGISNLYACLKKEEKQILKTRGFTFDSSDYIGGDTSASLLDDTLGITAEAKYIEANTEHMLTKSGNQKETLYINYTDSNDVVHNVMYYIDDDGQTYYKDNTGTGWGSRVKFSGIIKPNFNLYDSHYENVTGYGKNYSKKSGYDFIEKQNDVLGMFSITGTNQIDIRDFMKTQIYSSPFKCYWSTNTDNVLYLKKNVKLSLNSSSYYVYEYVLDNNEYFFYTDTLENSLVTLASGTLIRLYSDTELAKDEDHSVVVLRLTSNVDLEDIAEKGLGAFSDTKWETFKLRKDNYYFEFTENQIINLNEGDEIKWSGEGSHTCLLNPYEYNSQGEVEENYLVNDWYMLRDPEKFTYNNTYLPKFENIQGMDWKIRSSLTLSLDKEVGQTITHDGDSNRVIQKITLYTSSYEKINTGERIDSPNNYSIDSLYETHLLLKEFTSNTDSDYSLRSNYAITESGRKNISTHRYTVDNLLKDDLYVYAYKSEPLTYFDETLQRDEPFAQLVTFSDNYYKFTLSKKENIKIPLFIPSSCFGLIMVYYTPKLKEGITQYVKASVLERSTDLNPLTAIEKYDNYISKQKQTSPSTGYLTEVTLNPGINTLIIKSPGGYLKLNNSDGTSTLDDGTLVISELDIVDVSKEIDSEHPVSSYNKATGINSDLLGITDGATFINSYILDKSVDTNSIFYFNNPINKYNEIDVDKVDQYFWFNKNNICNKFVISELDCDFSDIQIAKSSRSQKW